MGLDREDKLNLMRSLNWDTLCTPEDMLDVAEGRLEKTGSFDRDALFVRSLERLPWHCVVGLWGVEQIKALYTEENACRLWPKGTRRRYDYAVGILRKKPVPAARWGTEASEQLRDTIFSYRWYSSR
jgi:hypothetical protein